MTSIRRESLESFCLAALSAGAAVVGLSEDDGHGGLSASLHPGLPVEAQLFWTPVAQLGVGVYGFANLNSKKSFAGALLCVQVGKPR